MLDLSSTRTCSNVGKVQRCHKTAISGEYPGEIIPQWGQLSAKKMCPRVIWGRGVRLSSQSLIFNQKLLLGRKTELGKSFGLDRLGIQIPLRNKQKNIWSKIHFSKAFGKGHKTQRGLARLTLQCMWSKHRAVDNWHLISVDWFERHLLNTETLKTIYVGFWRP